MCTIGLQSPSSESRDCYLITMHTAYASGRCTRRVSQIGPGGGHNGLSVVSDRDIWPGHDQRGAAKARVQSNLGRWRGGGVLIRGIMN